MASFPLLDRLWGHISVGKFFASKIIYLWAEFGCLRLRQCQRHSKNPNETITLASAQGASYPMVYPLRVPQALPRSDTQVLVRRDLRRVRIWRTRSPRCPSAEEAA